MIILALLIPIAFYFVIAFQPTNKLSESESDYFTARGHFGSTEFTSSSTAYGFQVSTIYPFLFWGASGFLFVPLVNALFWGVGILLLYFVVDKATPLISKGQSLPSILGELGGNNLKIVASILTVVGFVGYIVAELWFGSQIFTPYLTSKWQVYASAILLLSLVSGYLYRYGQPSSINTDQVQLLFTYLGIFGFITYLLFALVQSNTKLPGPLFWGLLLVAFLGLVVVSLRRGVFVKLNPRFNIVLNVLGTSAIILVVALSFYGVAVLPSDYNLEGFVDLEGFGIPGLMTMILLPVCWQFVDLTNWQRLLSVKMKESNHDVSKDLRKGLLMYAIESPFTWILFVVFGLLVNSSFG